MMKIYGLLAALLAIIASSCSGHAQPGIKETYRAPSNLNKYLLTGEYTDEIYFHIEDKSRIAHAPKALDHLITIAEKYSGVPARWVSIDSQRKFINEYCNDNAGDRIQDILITYEDTKDAYYGKVDRHGTQCLQIRINMTALDSLNFLWATRKKVEERTLVHEYGHLLGLASGSDHQYSKRCGHCKSVNCALTLPTGQAFLYTVFKTGMTFRNVNDYCGRCLYDIERAKRDWNEEAIARTSFE